MNHTKPHQNPYFGLVGASLLLLGLLFALTPPAILMHADQAFTATWSDEHWLAMGATAYLGSFLLGCAAIRSMGRPKGVIDR